MMLRAMESTFASEVEEFLTETETSKWTSGQFFAE